MYASEGHILIIAVRSVGLAGIQVLHTHFLGPSSGHYRGRLAKRWQDLQNLENRQSVGQKKNWEQISGEVHVDFKPCDEMVWRHLE